MSDAILLDLTRLTARAGRRSLSGIDRVELAWCAFLADGDRPAFGLIRTRLGFLLLDRTGLHRVCSYARQPLTSVGKPAVEDLIPSLRKIAIARAPRFGVSRMLRRHLPARTLYLNLGHSNISGRVMRAVKSVTGAKIGVLLHDAIPLDHPQYSSPGSDQRLARVFNTAAQHADGIIWSSESAKTDCLRHISLAKDVKQIVAPFGVGLEFEPMAQDDTPNGGFVMLATLEPRKNHAMICDIWEGLRADPPPLGVPKLHVIGAQGWLDPKTAQRVQALEKAGDVHIHQTMADQDVASLIAGSNGLLFPSFVEGFGLPALEAANLGCPCVCAPLPVFKEVLGDIPIYQPLTNDYRWRETIVELMDKEKQQAERRRIKAQVDLNGLPTWGAHFNIVLSDLS